MKFRKLCCPPRASVTSYADLPWQDPAAHSRVLIHSNGSTPTFSSGSTGMTNSGLGTMACRAGCPSTPSVASQVRLTLRFSLPGCRQRAPKPPPNHLIHHRPTLHSSYFPVSLSSRSFNSVTQAGLPTTAFTSAAASPFRFTAAPQPVSITTGVSGQAALTLRAT